MALNIVLYSPFISITQAASINGYKSDNGFSFGVVSAIYQDSFKSTVGVSVCFRLDDCASIAGTEGNYLIIDENLVLFRELAS